MRLLEDGQGAIVLGSDSGCALRVEEHSNLTKVISVDQMSDRLGLVFLINDGQVIGLYMDGKFAISNKVHVAFRFIFTRIFILITTLILLRKFGEDICIIFLFHKYHIRPGKYAVKLADKLCYALIILLQLQDLTTALWNVSTQCLHL